MCDITNTVISHSEVSSQWHVVQGLTVGGAGLVTMVFLEWEFHGP